MLNTNKIICVFIVFVLSQDPNIIFSQWSNIGNPTITNYSKYDYLGGTQNWEFEFTDESQLFVANNEGLLIYNGVKWDILKTPKKTIIRSIEFDKQLKRIYVGGQSEFGYFEYSRKKSKYVDLTNLIPEEHQEIEDIWDIVKVGQGIYFRSVNKLFYYNGDKVKVYDPEGTVTYFKALNGFLHFNLLEEGIFKIDANFDKSQLLHSFKKIEIVDILEIDEGDYLLLTINDGIYNYKQGQILKWKTNSDQFLIDNLINSSYYHSSDQLICIGTFLGGLTIFNKKGQMIYHFDKESGIQNNTIASISSDKGENIWIGTYYGIDRISLLPINQKIIPDNNLEGAVYDIEKWNDHYYFATSNGLYTLSLLDYYNPLSSLDFKIVEGTQGECWGIDLIGDNLFIAHNRGSFVMVDAYHCQKIDLDIGTWKYVALDERKILVGSYNGINIIKLEGDKWKFSHKIRGLDESSRILVLDQNTNLWMTHPYKGVYRLKSSNNFESTVVQKFDKADGILNFENIYGHDLNGSFIVSNENEIFAFDYETSKFVSDDRLNKLFENERLIRLIGDGNELWYISDKSAGKLHINQTGSSLDYYKNNIIENNNSFVAGFENLSFFDDQFLFCGSDQGLFYTDLGSMNKIGIPKVRVVEVSSSIHNLCFYDSFSDTTKQVNIPADIHSIVIGYSSTFTVPISGNVKYSTRLIGINDQWSNWSLNKSREFNKLDYGNYTFEVKALINGSELSEVERVFIKVSPPIYLTKVAKLFYLLAFGGALFLFVTSSTKKHKMEKRQLLKEKELVLDMANSLEEENYNIQLESKNKELAYSTMHLLQKNELISKLKNELVAARQLINNPQAKKELKKIIGKLADNQRLEEDWDNFSIHFDKVHHEFLKRLKDDFPILSSKDLKLSAYLRLNLTTKEVAPLMGISVRGVEISRYRLRKKLNLDSNENLNEFMIKY